MAINPNRSIAYHSRFCALRNKREALCFLLVCCTLAFLCWRDLHKGLPEGQGRLTLLLGHLTGLLLLAQLMLLFRCFRERAVLALAMIWFAVGLVQGLLPAVIEPAVAAVREASFLLWVVAAAISASMLASAVRASPRDPQGVR